MSKGRYKSTRLKAAQIKEIIRQNYEPGRHDKCKLAVYRNVVSKQQGISERTFWRLMNEVEAEQPQIEDKQQLRMFDDDDELTA